MTEIERLEAKLAGLKKAREQLTNNLYAQDGAIQVVEQLLDEIKKEQEAKDGHSAERRAE